jgi:hypothetical protein
MRPEGLGNLIKTIYLCTGLVVCVKSYRKLGIMPAASRFHPHSGPSSNGRKFAECG